MSHAADLNLADYIRDIPDFPKPGILFRDVTPLLASPEAFRRAVVDMANPFGVKNRRGGRSRSAWFHFCRSCCPGTKRRLGAVRKPGKLPSARDRSAMTWSTAAIRSKSIPMQLPRLESADGR